jgi:hypothetical protein
MNIDLLYFDGCPSWPSGLDNLKAALAAESIQATIRLVRIDDPEEAKRRRFLGSPSFQVNGIDLWPEERASYALSCRVYETPEGMKGSPNVAMLRERLLDPA